jgi:glycosyltransferase involved in cell wall biosynthesis
MARGSAPRDRPSATETRRRATPATTVIPAGSDACGAARNAPDVNVALVLDFTGGTEDVRTVVEQVLGHRNAAVLAPTALLNDVLRRRPLPRCSHLVVVGDPPLDGIGYGMIPFVAAILRPRTVTLLDIDSLAATSTSLVRYLGTSAPFSAGQLLSSGLVLAGQRAIARPTLLRAAPGPARGGSLQRMLYLRPSAGVPMPVGGSVTHAHGMLKALSALGITTDAFTNDRAIAATAAAEHRVEPGWQVVHVPPTMKAVPASAAAGADLALFAATRRVAKACDMVYQRHERFSLAGALVARASRLPLFLEFNSPAELFHPRATVLTRQRQRCEHAALFSATRVFVVSEVAKALVLERGLPEERVIVNPNGVDFDRFASAASDHNFRRQIGFSDDEVVFGFVSSFIEFHGAAVLAEAFLEFAKTFPTARLLLVGDGDERPRVARILGDLVRERRVVMTGRVPPSEIPHYLAACDALVSPHVPLPDETPFFGSPTKLFEYMAAGRAIIASRLGQIADVLDDDQTALLIDPGEPMALVAALKRLADNRAVRERLGRNAQAKARQYTWLANAQRILDAFQSLPETEPPRGARSRG